MAQTILLVEDNQTDIDLTRRAFRKLANDYRLVVKDDGQDALDYLLSAGNQMPQLILLDLKMPRVGGLEVLAQIRKNVSTRRIPVVIMTSSAEECDITAAYDLGASSYICKPVDFSIFTETLQHLVSYWFDLNRLPPAGL
ncbi:MAG: two-component system response regulator [Candidatus Riflebacteria bacterium HGW-Riflebacteria-2]|jgi:CheY-like chemotaxis protein|nr:MAG: two-component system response regulator [Candidatus Riflebacteria bacterium HGW-Riflebacteria-2]